MKRYGEEKIGPYHDLVVRALERFGARWRLVRLTLSIDSFAGIDRAVLAGGLPIIVHPLTMAWLSRAMQERR